MLFFISGLKLQQSPLGHERLKQLTPLEFIQAAKVPPETIETFISGTFQCTNDGMFANPDDHHAFWHCAHGAGYLKHCPASLIWSQVQQNCIWNVPEPTITVTTTLLTTTETSTTMPMSSFLPPQCSNYTSITDGTRRTNNINLGAQSDNSYFSKTPTWVRFEGAAGTRLANYSVPSPRCGSEGAGWLKHPTEPT
ncbi:unnamed protein product, partial [Rotaria sordida]